MCRFSLKKIVKNGLSKIVGSQISIPWACYFLKCFYFPLGIAATLSSSTAWAAVSLQENVLNNQQVVPCKHLRHVDCDQYHLFVALESSEKMVGTSSAQHSSQFSCDCKMCELGIRNSSFLFHHCCNFNIYLQVSCLAFLCDNFVIHKPGIVYVKLATLLSCDTAGDRTGHILR